MDMYNKQINRRSEDKVRLSNPRIVPKQISPALMVQGFISRLNANKYMENIKPDEIYYSYEIKTSKVICTMVYNEIPYPDSKGPALWVWNHIDPLRVNWLEYEFVNTKLKFVLEGETRVKEVSDECISISIDIDSIKNKIILPKEDISNINDSIKCIYIRPDIGEIEFIIDKNMDISEEFEISVYKIRRKS